MEEDDCLFVGLKMCFLEEVNFVAHCD